MNTIRVSAKTVSDAITEACQRLSVTSDMLEYEVVEEGTTSARLTWATMEGMKYYEVYIADANQETYRRIKVQTTTTYISKALKAGTTYNFKVRGYRIHNDAKVYSAYSNVVTYTVK